MDSQNSDLTLLCCAQLKLSHQMVPPTLFLEALEEVQGKFCLPLQSPQFLFSLYSHLGFLPELCLKTLLLLKYFVDLCFLKYIATANNNSSKWDWGDAFVGKELALQGKHQSLDPQSQLRSLQVW